MSPSRRRQLAVTAVVITGLLAALWLTGTSPGPSEALAADEQGGCTLPPSTSPPPAPSTTQALPAPEPGPPEADDPPARAADGDGDVDAAPAAPLAPPVDPRAPKLTQLGLSPRYAGLPGTGGKIVSLRFLPSGLMLVNDAEGRWLVGSMSDDTFREVGKGKRYTSTPDGPWLQRDRGLVHHREGAFRFPGPVAGAYDWATSHKQSDEPWPVALRVDDLTASRVAVGSTDRHEPLQALAIVDPGLAHLTWSVDGDQLGAVQDGQLLTIDLDGTLTPIDVRPSGPPIATDQGWAVVEGDTLRIVDGPVLQTPVSGTVGSTAQGDWLITATDAGLLAIPTGVSSSLLIAVPTPAREPDLFWLGGTLMVAYVTTVEGVDQVAWSPVQTRE